MDPNTVPPAPGSKKFASLGKSRRNAPGDQEGAGLKCEMKVYETRYNSKGKKVTLQAGTHPIDSDRKWDHGCAFVLTRIYDNYQDLQNTQLDIRSPYVKKALQETIAKYPSVDFHATVVTIQGTPKCIFHYRKELQEYGSNLRNQDHAEHLIFLLEYMYEVFASETEHWYNLMEMKRFSRRLDFTSLWMAFRPGDHVYTLINGIDKVLKLESMTRCECPDPYCWKRRWRIVASDINFDGESYGYEDHYFSIDPYEGYMILHQLKIFPFEYHPRKDELTATLVERGKKFISLQGIHYRSYNGVAEALSPWRVNTIFGESDEFPLQSMMTNSRVMIDSTTFSMMKASNKIELDRTLDPEKTENREDAHPKFTNEDFLICASTIPGFCLTTKRWCIFQVDLINEIEFNLRAFETLLLPQHQKNMIHSLVRVHSSDGMGFDDFIKGKGKGMIFLLHGVPGVGKTLTAESVADYTKRPLYVVNCGDLGVDINSVEANLSDALRLATTWNAIVLIDEADIFLEARSNKDLERNSLVAVFLRLLEYYQGILILTTNRIGVFDPAFKSRIHLAIKYNALSPKSRRDLWKVFITSASSDITPEWLNDEILDRLATERINGRQIKNTVRTAQALAVSENCPLGVKHIDMSLTAMSMFDADFAEEASEYEDHGTHESRSKRRREH